MTKAVVKQTSNYYTQVFSSTRSLSRSTWLHTGRWPSQIFITSRRDEASSIVTEEGLSYSSNYFILSFEHVTCQIELGDVVNIA